MAAQSPGKRRGLILSAFIDFVLYGASIFAGWYGIWWWFIAPLAVAFLWCFRAEMKYLRWEDTFRLSPDEATPEDLARYKRLEEIRMRAHGKTMLHVTLANLALFLIGRAAAWFL